MNIKYHLIGLAPTVSDQTCILATGALCRVQMKKEYYSADPDKWTMLRIVAAP